MAETPMTAAALAPRVKALLEGADLDAFGGLLDPHVFWGAPGDPEACTSPADVLSWWRRSHAAGVRASVTEVETHGERLLVGRPGAVGEEQRWQVLSVGSAGVREIIGYEDRDEALAHATAAD